MWLSNFSTDQWIQIATSVGTFVAAIGSIITALATYSVVKEMATQRTALRKPELVVRELRCKVEVDGSDCKWLFVEDDPDSIVNNTRGVFFLGVLNIGSGVAREVNAVWSANYAEIIGTMSVNASEYTHDETWRAKEFCGKEAEASGISIPFVVPSTTTWRFEPSIM